MSATALQDRIRAALLEPTTTAALALLIPEVEKASAQAGRAYDEEAKRARDPSISDEDAARAGAALLDLGLKRDRLAAAIGKLKERESAVREAEIEAAIDREYQAAKAERDQLVEDLKTKWPSLESEMVELLRRMHASDARIGRSNASRSGKDLLMPADRIARGLESNSPVSRLTSSKLVAFDQMAGHMNYGHIWPNHGIG